MSKHERIYYTFPMLQNSVFCQCLIGSHIKNYAVEKEYAEGINFTVHAHEIGLYY